MIGGWLLYDLMHEKNAANTNPNGNRSGARLVKRFTLSAASKFFIRQAFPVLAKPPRDQRSARESRRLRLQ
jgi:hypothetical protein